MKESQNSGLSTEELFKNGVGITYSDFTILNTTYSNLRREKISLKTDLGKSVTLQLPIIASPMDTVTNAKVCIAMALEGGIGALHYNYKTDDGRVDIDAQIAEIEKVKRYQSGMIEEPITVSPEFTIAQAIERGDKYKESGLIIKTFPVTENGESNGKLVGLLRKQDYRRGENTELKVRERMLTLDELVFEKEPMTLKKANEVLWNKRINYLPVVDRKGHLKYLVTQTDVEKNAQYPFATKDEKNRLRVLFAVETWPDRALERLEKGFEAGADGVIIDTSQGFTRYEGDMIKYVHKNYPGKLLIGGNISTKEAVRFLEEKVDAYRCGQGSGSICTTAGAIGISRAGATSQCVGCNTDLIQMREAMKLVKTGLVNVISNMSKIASENKDLVTLAFTHYRPAQPTTIGKRFTLYIEDLILDLDTIESIEFKARGIKGATGTQASFIELFDGDYEKVKNLDTLFSKKIGFDKVFPVTGQTYPRKFDTKVMEALAGIGVSLYRFADDIRHSAGKDILDEPFEIDQTGSSAMPYKRNPMRSERTCSLSRELIGLVANSYDTAKSQWYERTLDDSAIRRMDIPRSFLLADSILILANNITERNVDPKKGRPLTFYPNQIRKQLNENLPFMCTERIMMNLVQGGHNRQEMHQIIKEHSIAASLAIKEDGASNTLFERLGNDSRFPLSKVNLEGYLENPERYAGAASVQTEEYLANVVGPKLRGYEDLIGKSSSEIKV